MVLIIGLKSKVVGATTIVIGWLGDQSTQIKTPTIL
tara:strand:- start:289 stop:396 length:108 start_codon:yes stop_codon:yes gene_type:complete